MAVDENVEETETTEGEAVESTEGEKPVETTEVVEDDSPFVTEEEMEEGKGDDKPEEDNIDKEDEKIISKQVQREIAPIKEAMYDNQIVAEVDGFLGSKGGEVYRPYEQKIKEFAKNPKLAGLKISAIANIAAGNDLMKLGAERERAAGTEAIESSTGGDTRRPSSTGKIPDVRDMSREDFGGLVEKVRQGQFKS